MKHVYRLIGFILVLAIVAGLVLYALNGFGYLHGPLSEWVNNIANHFQGAVNDTKTFLDQEGVKLPFPTATPFPAATNDPSLVNPLLVPKLP